MPVMNDLSLSFYANLGMDISLFKDRSRDDSESGNSCKDVSIQHDSGGGNSRRVFLRSMHVPHLQAISVQGAGLRATLSEINRSLAMGCSIL